MKKYLILLCALSVVVFTTHAFAEYDKEAVVEVMRANGASMGAIKKAAESGDFFTAAEKLMEVAKNMKSLEAVAPPKGSKEDWDKNHQSLIKAALKGIGACGEEDAEQLNTYLGEIGALIKEGHGMFR